MSFEALARSAEKLRIALHSSTGRHLIAEVSLEAPNHSQGEAAFIKSVLWCYALWFEACQPAGRYLTNIVRNSEPEEHKTASRAFRDVQNLRTFHAHNLLPHDKNDEYKLNQAKAWLSQNGGAERDWDGCTVKLCSGLATAVDILCAHWNRVTASPEDASTAIQGLLDELDRNWEPHTYDNIIVEFADMLGLSDIDPVKYRNARIKDWQEIAKFFLDRTSAEAALRRTIHQEMKVKFGTASI